MGPDPRDEIAEAVHYGRMKPEEAEAKLEELGLPPLAPQPDPSRYNPMSEVWWSLPMTVAWIAWRNSADVRDAWDTYRCEQSFWIFERWRVGFDGPVHEGFMLKNKKPATLSQLVLTQAYRQQHETLPEGAVNIGDARSKLRTALVGNATQATGVSTSTRERVIIPDYEWRDLYFYEERDRDVVRFRDGHAVSQRGYDELAFRRQHVMSIWNPLRMDRKEVILPETVRPDGPGYMPLYCAVQWIATRGGTFSFEPTYATVWDRAYAELLARISTEEVAVTGMRGGIREKLEGHLFASIVVDHIFGDKSIDMIFMDELHLQSYVYIDEEHWRNGLDDCLRNRGGIQWSQLMVRKSDVSRWWPFDEEREPPETHSGGPGRPSAMHLVEAEYDARRRRGEARGRLREVAAELAEWGRTTHRTLRMPKARTIENALRDKHRQPTK